MLPGHHRAPGGLRARDRGGARAASPTSQVARARPQPRGHRARRARVRGRGASTALLVVMLTYGPGMRVARALSETRLPICLANIQPVPEVTAEWDMADLTYNQGIHGAQDTANAMMRAGVRFHVITDDWQADSFRDAVERWARVARAITAWRSLRVAIFGYAMNEMGDIRVDEGALLRALGPQVDLHRPRRPVPRRRGGGARGDRRGDRRGGRALRDRPRAQRRGARGPHPHADRARAHPARARLPARTRRTSTRSPRTGASRACRWPPPRR